MATRRYSSLAALLLPRASHSQYGTGSNTHPAARSCRRLSAVHGARPVLNRLGGVGKRRAAAPIAAGAGVPHRVATAAIIFAARGPPPLSLVAPRDRVVAARAATPLAPGWLLAMLLAVPAAVIVVGTAAVVIAPPAGHRAIALLGFFGCNTRTHWGEYAANRRV